MQFPPQSLSESDSPKRRTTGELHADKERLPLVLLDIDGVINKRISNRNPEVLANTDIGTASVLFDTQRAPVDIVWSKKVVQELNRWHDEKLADIR
jgi:hypothetical protein